MLTKAIVRLAKTKEEAESILMNVVKNLMKGGTVGGVEGGGSAAASMRLNTMEVDQGGGSATATEGETMGGTRGSGSATAEGPDQDMSLETETDTEWFKPIEEEG